MIKSTPAACAASPQHPLAAADSTVLHAANNVIVGKERLTPLLPRLATYSLHYYFTGFNFKSTVIDWAPEGVQTAQQSLGSLLRYQPGPAVMSFVKVCKIIYAPSLHVIGPVLLGCRVETSFSSRSPMWSLVSAAEPVLGQPTCPQRNLIMSDHHLHSCWHSDIIQ